MPRFRERPHVSCYGRRDRATSGWARHGQIIRVALALLFYSRHISLPDIEARSEQHRQRRPGSTQLDKYASSVRKMHWTVRPFLCRKPNTQRKRCLSSSARLASAPGSTRTGLITPPLPAIGKSAASTRPAAPARGLAGINEKPRHRWGQRGAFNGRFALEGLSPGHRTERRRPR